MAKDDLPGFHVDDFQRDIADLDRIAGLAEFQLARIGLQHGPGLLAVGDCAQEFNVGKRDWPHSDGRWFGFGGRRILQRLAESLFPMRQKRCTSVSVVEAESAAGCNGSSNADASRVRSIRIAMQSD